MNGIQVRSIPKSIIFSFITCGIYGIYWFIKMTNEVHTAVYVLPDYLRHLFFLLGV